MLDRAGDGGDLRWRKVRQSWSCVVVVQRRTVILTVYEPDLTRVTVWEHLSLWLARPTGYGNIEGPS